jgi:hypothetical protein
MGLPVVIVASGGLPVTQAANGLPVTVATNGYGIPVTLVTSGGMSVTATAGSALGGSDKPPNYSMVSLRGLFQLNGQSANLVPPVIRPPIIFSVDAGVFALTGEDMTPVTITGYQMSAGTGAFALTGVNAILTKSTVSSGVTPVARYASAVDFGFADVNYDWTGVPIGTADANRVVTFFIYDDVGRGPGGYTVTVNRSGSPITATQIRKNGNSVLCYAVVPTGTTCDIRIHADNLGAFGIIAISVATLITATPAPTSSNYIAAPGYGPDPQHMDGTITIPTNGCGVLFFSCPRGTNDCRPGIFAGGGFADVPALSAAYLVGNGNNTIGAFSTTVGTSNPDVSGSGAGFGYTAGSVAGATWGP